MEQVQEDEDQNYEFQMDEDNELQHQSSNKVSPIRASVIEDIEEDYEEAKPMRQSQAGHVYQIGESSRYTSMVGNDSKNKSRRMANVTEEDGNRYSYQHQNFSTGKLEEHKSFENHSLS